MQLKALRLGTMAFAGVVFLTAALPTPHAAAQATDDAVAQTTDDPAISSEREAPVRIERAVLNLVRHVGKDREREVRSLRSTYGSSTSRDTLESQIAWIEEVESGDPRVMYEMALRLRDGDGLPQHRDAAVTWLERAGDHGVPEGLFEASRMLLANPLREDDIFRSDDFLKRSARGGVAEAQKVLGLQFASGGARPFRKDRRREREYREAYIWLLLAEANGADVGDMFAASEKFLLDEERKTARAIVDRGVGRNLPRYWPGIEDGEVEDWWEKWQIALRWRECGLAISILAGAAQAGETEAELELARSYRRGVCVATDAAKALAHYVAAAKIGDTRAILRVGFMYYDGRGAPKDLQTASRWFKAAALNLVAASPRLDRRMEALERNLPGGDAFRARAIPPELAAEIDWLNEIERGDPRVMYETALRLRDGDGLPQHRDAALIWFERAGDHGVPEGFHAAARMRLDDLDIVLDPVDTFLNRMAGENLLERAARHGLAAAQKELSLYELADLQQYGNYDNGPYIWLLLAQENGAAVSAAEIAATRDFLTEGAREDARATVRQALGKTRLPRMWPLILDDDDPTEIFKENLRAALRWHECGRALTIIDDAQRAGIAAAESELGFLNDEGTCID